MYVILGLIIGKWIGISLTFIIVILSCKELWCCCRSNSNDTEVQPSNQRILDYVTNPGECCFNIFKRTCVATKKIEYFNGKFKTYSLTQLMHFKTSYLLLTDVIKFGRH